MLNLYLPKAIVLNASKWLLSSTLERDSRLSKAKMDFLPRLDGLPLQPHLPLRPLPQDLPTLPPVPLQREIQTPLHRHRLERQRHVAHRQRQRLRGLAALLLRLLATTVLRSLSERPRRPTGGPTSAPCVGGCCKGAPPPCLRTSAVWLQKSELHHDKHRTPSHLSM